MNAQIIRTCLLLLFASTIFGIAQSQDIPSVQINGGVISPMNSSKGFTGIVQFNYSITKEIKLYAYTGYSAWDKRNIVIKLEKEFYANDEKMYFNSYSADDHILIPLYLGGRLDLHSNKLFTSFLTAEIGYSYLSYNSYDQWREVNPETGEVLNFHPDAATKKEIKENLFGIGIGAGLAHSISESLDLLLSFKLNSNVNESYNGLFSRRGTYTSLMAGFNFKI